MDSTRALRVDIGNRTDFGFMIIFGPQEGFSDARGSSAGAGSRRG
jgi:hypothetical protein